MSILGTPERPGRIPVTVHGDDPLTRAGLASHLRASPLIEVCDGNEDGDRPEGIAVIFADRIDRLTLSRLRALSAAQKVVLIVTRLRETELLRALDAGVSAIMFRHQVTPDRLLEAVRAAARDDRDLPSDAVGQLVDAIVRLRREGSTELDGGDHPPTPRELDVLRLLSEGLETREIAQRLAFSERTVKNVLHGLTVRFGLKNRTHAVAHALREGYL